MRTKKLFVIAFGDGKVEGGGHYETTFNPLPVCRLGNHILEVKSCSMSCGLQANSGNGRVFAEFTVLSSFIFSHGYIFGPFFFPPYNMSFFLGARILLLLVYLFIEFSARGRYHSTI